MVPLSFVRYGIIQSDHACTVQKESHAYSLSIILAAYDFPPAFTRIASGVSLV